MPKPKSRLMFSGNVTGMLREILKHTHSSPTASTWEEGIRMEVGAQSVGFVTEVSKPGSACKVTVD